MNLINKDVYDIIRRHYYCTNQNRGNSEYSFGFGLLHYAFIRNIRPQNILVVGSLRGYIPIICALACKDEGIGHVDFVDEGGTNWGGGGIWQQLAKRPVEEQKMYWSRLGVQDYIDLHVMRIEDFPFTKTYQYVNLDADHSYEGSKRQYELIWPHVDKAGLFTFHDIGQRRHSAWGQFGVKDLWQELEGEKLPFYQSIGLGVLRKS